MNISREYKPYIDDAIMSAFGGPTIADADGNEQTALKIVRRLDEGRIGCFGGYPSCVVFADALMIVASVEGKNEPTLEVVETAEFIEANREFIKDQEPE